MLSASAYFINEIKTKGYDVFGVNLFPHKLMSGMRFTREKRSNPTILLSSSVQISSSDFKAV